MKMKLYYAAEEINNEECRMIAGPMTYEEASKAAHRFISNYEGYPKRCVIVHRWVEVQD